MKGTNCSGTQGTLVPASTMEGEAHSSSERAEPGLQAPIRAPLPDPQGNAFATAAHRNPEPCPHPRNLPVSDSRRGAHRPWGWGEEPLPPPHTKGSPPAAQRRALRGAGSANCCSRCFARKPWRGALVTAAVFLQHLSATSNQKDRGQEGGGRGVENHISITALSRRARDPLCCCPHTWQMSDRHMQPLKACMDGCL